MNADCVVYAKRIVTCNGDDEADARGRLGIIEDAALAITGDRMTWVGARADAPQANQVIDARDSMILPGLVDPHTHLVFAGSRADEFAQKMRGEDYRAIAAAGGGILSTVRATRAASDEALLRLATARALAMRAHGVTCVEIKSGYGLTLEDELRSLRIGRALDSNGVVRTSTTLLAAHAVPPEFSNDRAGYVRLVAEQIVPQAALDQLADAADVYLDANAFSVAEAQAVLSAAQRYGLAVRAHVGQFADIGGAQLVASLRGLSCDHLEDVSDDGLDAMARSGTRAVLLPGAWRTLRQFAPDARRIRSHGVRVAIGTDCNPGTSPCVDLWLCAAIAVRDAYVDPDEAILAITVEAARVLDRQDVGQIREGALADFAFYAANDPTALVYALGGTRPTRVFISGKEVPTTGLPDVVW